MELTVRGVEVHLVDEGAGMLALFLHGNPDSADLWDGVIARLRPHHRCLAPDLPGFGRSIAPKDFDCSFENLARFVDGMVQASGIGEPMALVEHPPVG
jgi:pimeloyl-ACP methyl ester carboxylesterase